MEHDLLLPVFKQLNMLKWQIADNCAPDIFTGRVFIKNINRRCLPNWFKSATALFAVQLDSEFDSWELDQIREFWPISSQDRARATSLLEKGTAASALNGNRVPGLFLLYRQTVFSAEKPVTLHKVTHASQRKKKKKTLVQKQLMPEIIFGTVCLFVSCERFKIAWKHW